MSFDIPEMHTPIYHFRRSTPGAPEARYETLHRAAEDVLSNYIRRVKYVSGPAALPPGGNALPGGAGAPVPGGGGPLPLPPGPHNPMLQGGAMPGNMRPFMHQPAPGIGGQGGPRPVFPTPMPQGVCLGPNGMPVPWPGHIPGTLMVPPQFVLPRPPMPPQQQPGTQPAGGGCATGPQPGTGPVGGQPPAAHVPLANAGGPQPQRRGILLQ